MTTKTTRKTIDTYAELALQIRELQNQLDDLRPIIIGLGEGHHEGKEHAVDVVHSLRSSVSASLAKSLLTAEQIQRCTVVNDVTQIRVEK